jgi:hypothetical protein
LADSLNMAYKIADDDDDEPIVKRNRRDALFQCNLLETQCKEGPEGNSQSLSGQHL